MVLQILGLLGLVALVYTHEHKIRARDRARIDVMRRAQHRNRRGF